MTVDALVDARAFGRSEDPALVRMAGFCSFGLRKGRAALCNTTKDIPSAQKNMRIMLFCRSFIFTGSGSFSACRCSRTPASSVPSGSHAPRANLVGAVGSGVRWLRQKRRTEMNFCPTNSLPLSAKSASGLGIATADPIANGCSASPFVSLPTFAIRSHTALIRLAVVRVGDGFVKRDFPSLSLPKSKPLSGMRR